MTIKKGKHCGGRYSGDFHRVNATIVHEIYTDKVAYKYLTRADLSAVAFLGIMQPAIRFPHLGTQVLSYTTQRVCEFGLSKSIARPFVIIFN